MTLENCLKCRNHISYISGYVECNYWKQIQQHVTNQLDNGTATVVGCAMEESKAG